MPRLRKIECRGRGCGHVFYICQRCYRRQGYCSDACRARARKEQCRAAQVRYLKKTKGRQSRARASKRWRNGETEPRRSRNPRPPRLDSGGQPPEPPVGPGSPPAGDAASPGGDVSAALRSGVSASSAPVERTDARPAMLPYLDLSLRAPAGCWPRPVGPPYARFAAAEEGLDLSDTRIDIDQTSEPPSDPCHSLPWTTRCAHCGCLGRVPEPRRRP